MLIPAESPFDLESTLYSGQAFRWRPDDGWDVGVVFNNIVRIRQVAEGIEFTSGPDTEETVAPLLRDHLDLGVDIDRVCASIDKDSRIGPSIAEYRGMHILRQDPWECLIAFIISSYSNIQRISKHVEDLANEYGDKLTVGAHRRSTFPGPETLTEVGEQRLREMGLGYRAPYVARTAAMVADGEIDLFALREASYQEALEALLQLPGVGDKVANCVMLFSLDKPNAFPVDVWVQRALQDWYLGPAKKLSPVKMRLWAQEYFGPHAGYANQYLFHGRRLRGRAGSEQPQPSSSQAQA